MFSPRSLAPRRRRSVLGLLGSLILMSGMSVVSATAAAGATASTVAPVPSVGAIFADGATPQHTCTGSLLAAGSGLVLTAAHCVHGTGAGMTFVPGYDGTKKPVEPYGAWTVVRAWMPRLWVSAQDPSYDYAILQVDDRVIKGRIMGLSELVKGNAAGVAAALPDWVSVTGYVAGSGDAPISCKVAPRVEQGYPSFRCGGYLAGSSGSPWIDSTSVKGTSTVDAVIGGLHQGGCTDSTSYSSAFDTQIYVLEVRAILGLPADSAPSTGDDGC
ncbi:V8-like Glu-specific endopeptidase [Nakamurella panacisegetis]|uniref:V8-like Glu-specific endopeptidase n=1 Tax=Nakamurella panacisegetis TaxID=1090615 RepID=A0A1H0M8Y9_9ACTN|nr:trypsin-like peptidase domain-containing protein [Nakamurella panacisegetis]SDO76864.1 V8-like Glu-specific endopeptidase [Nakamurella panacisegetis]